VIPDFRSLGLPSQLEDVATLRDGIVLVTGPRGSGKSSTLAALLDRINEHQTCHIITIEDPIEFLHNHKRATVHQRELHSDTPSFALALRAALRQAPRVILVGEIHDRATMETVIEAAETGHLVLSSFNSVDVAKTVSRIIGLFSPGEQHLIRGRLAKTLRYIVSQRLIPRRDGGGRVAAVEIFKSTPRSSGHIECDDPGGANLLDAIRSGEAEGMQHFDASIEKLVRDGVIDREAAVVYASDAQSLQRSLERDAGYIFAGDGKKR
jgi:twitching motility protein PilT